MSKETRPKGESSDLLTPELAKTELAPSGDAETRTGPRVAGATAPSGPPGARVVLKPNWVLDHNQAGAGLDCLVTHPSVIEAALQYVALAQPSARDREPAPFQLTAPSSLEAWEKECSIRWEPDLRLRPIEPAEARAPQAESAASATAGEPWSTEDIEPVEPVLPIYANLIEFPRELVAARRMRPPSSG